MASFTLTNGDDDFPGIGVDTSGDDSIRGLGGDDTIYAGSGENTVYGGEGDDHVPLDFAVEDDQIVYGGGGNDQLSSWGGDDWLDGGVGNDTLGANGGVDSLFGGGGADEIYIFFSTSYFESNIASVVEAGNGDDLVSVMNLPVEVSGGKGNDTFLFFWSFSHGDPIPAPSSFDGGAGKDSLDLTISTARGLDDAIVIAGGTAGLTASVDGVTMVTATSVESLSTYLTAAVIDVTATSGDDSLILDTYANIDTTATVNAASGDDVVWIKYGYGTFDLAGGRGDDVLVIDSRDLAGDDFEFATAILLDAGVLTFGSAEAGSVSGFERYEIYGSAMADELHLGAGDDLAAEAEKTPGGNDLFEMGGGNDSAYGGMGNDTLAGEAGNDQLFGGNGDDVIRGGAGADTMAGAKGADVFVFSKIADSGTATGSIDNINFFEGGPGGVDRIDLSEIDAIASTGANDAFTFIGSEAFTAEGQVRVQQNGAATYIVLNTTGTSGAEMKICLPNFDAATLAAGDFIL